MYQPWIWTPSRTQEHVTFIVTLYQPEIWAPSKTFKPGLHCHKLLYQPGIWTPSKTPGAETRTAHRLYQPEIWLPSRTKIEMMENTPSIVSTWELPRRGHDGPDEDGAVDCINLGPERFREQVRLAGCRVRTLYQPGIWAPSRITPSPTTPTRALYQPGIWTPSRTVGSELRSSKTIVSTWNLVHLED